jgi:hypothetical protein
MVSWVEQQPAGDADKGWRAGASNSDGSVLIAGVYGGRLYISKPGPFIYEFVGSISAYASPESICSFTPYMSPWTEQKPAGDLDRGWRAGASNSIGDVLVAGVYGGRLYISSPATFFVYEFVGSISAYADISSSYASGHPPLTFTFEGSISAYWEMATKIRYRGHPRFAQFWIYLLARAARAARAARRRRKLWQA